jgi:hypothetical protein
MACACDGRNKCDAHLLGVSRIVLLRDGERFSRPLVVDDEELRELWSALPENWAMFSEYATA